MVDRFTAWRLGRVTAESSTDHRGHVVVSGQPFDETLAFFTDTLGMRLDRISPADDPALAVLSGHGISLMIDRDIPPTPGRIRIESGARPATLAPNRITVEFVNASHHVPLVPDLENELVISNAVTGSDWVTGRAGMRYRDLIPSRLGGRYIASHIEVCDGGPVPDLVHHHAIRFQMIFCHRGWVDVVYEDQGEPFRLEAGDCVLQPPHIRHRVLASSAGAKVVEIGCPAEHDTLFDYGLELPTPELDVDRLFGGQKFVRHQRTIEPWVPSAHPGFEAQETAIEQATDGLARVRVLRATTGVPLAPTRHDAEFWFLFVLAGSADFAVDGSVNAATLETGDSVAVPADLTWSLRNVSADLELLEVVVP